MTPNLRSKEVLQSIVPSDVDAYLRSHNWEQTEQISDHATIWTKRCDSGGDFEVLLPLIPSYADYATRIADALNTLSVAENRDKSRVFHDIITTNSDVLRVGLRHRSVRNTSIPLEIGARVAIELNNLMMAAARAAIRLASDEVGPDQNAAQFVADLMIRQEDDAAFLLEIESKVTPAQNHTTAALRRKYSTDPEPFGRSVMLCTRNSLAAIEGKLAASPSADTNTIRDIMSIGISADLCEALVALSIGGSADELSFQFNWATTRPVAATAADTIRFGRDDFPVLAEAARILREESTGESQSAAASIKYAIPNEMPLSAVREEPTPPATTTPTVLNTEHRTPNT